MDFLGNIAKSIGDFFAGDKKKKKEESKNNGTRKPVSSTKSQPTRGQQLVDPLTKAAAKTPQAKTAPKTVRQAGVLLPEFLPESERTYNPVAKTAPAPPAEKQPGFMEQLGAGVQQAAGSVADTAIKGGAVIQEAAIKMNPVASEATKQKQLKQFYEGVLSEDQGTGKVRSQLFNTKDLTGQNIVGTRDVEPNVDRINAGKGTTQDFMALAGKSAQIGLDATMLLNPAARTVGAAKTVAQGGQVTAKTVAKTARRDAAFFGPTQGTATGLTSYGQDGDVAKAIDDGVKSTVMTATAVAGLSAMGQGLGRALGAATNKLKSIPDDIEVSPGISSPNLAREAKKTAQMEVDEVAGEMQRIDQEIAVQTQNMAQEVQKAQQISAQLDQELAVAPPAPKPLPTAELPQKPKNVPIETPAKAAETPQMTSGTPEEISKLQVRRDILEQDLRDLTDDGMPTGNVKAELSRVNQELGKLQRPRKATPEEMAQLEADRRVAEGVKDTKVIAEDAKAEASVEAPVAKKDLKTPAGRTVTKSDRERFKENAIPITDDTHNIIERADSGDIAGAKSGVDRLIERPEYTTTPALQERVNKLNKHIAKQEKKQKTVAPAKTVAPVKESAFGKPDPETEAGKMVNKAFRGTGKVKKVLRDGTHVKDKDGVQLAPKVGESMAKQQVNASERSVAVAELKKFIARDEKMDVNKALDDEMLRVSTLKDEDLIQEALTIRNGLSEGDIAGADRVVKAYSLIEPLGRLTKKAKDAGDEDLAKRVADATDEVFNIGTEAPSKGGLNAAISGIMMARATPELLTRHLVRKIEKLGGEVTEAQKDALRTRFISHHEAKASLDEINNSIDASFEKLKKGKQVSLDEIDEMAKTVRDREGVFHDTMGLVNREYSDIINANNKAGKTDTEMVGKWAATYEAWTKAAMLSAPSGRIRDLAVTLGGALPDNIVVDAISSMGGKVVNAASGKPRILDKTVGSRWATRRGLAEGWQKIKDDWSGASGEQKYLTTGATNAADNSQRTRSGLNTAYVGKRPAKALRAVHTLTAAPTHITEAYKTNILYRYGRLEAKKLGYTGDQAEAIARLYTVKPPKEVLEKAEQKMLVISSMHDNWMADKATSFTEGIRKWASNKRNFPNKPSQHLAQIAVRQADLMTMPFKKFAFGSMSRMLTDQLPVANAAKAVTALVKSKRKDGKFTDEAIQTATDAIAREGWNAVKFATAVTAVTPFLSDTDGNGKSYTPPYVHVGDEYIPLSSFGPVLGAPILYAYAWKKAVEDSAENGAVHASANWIGKVIGGVLTTTGIDNLASGNNAMGRAFEGLGEWSGGADTVKSMQSFGSNLAKDATTQWAPALGRDLNSVIDWAMGTELAPKTKYENEDGTKNYVLNAIAPAASAIPGVSQMMPRNEEGKAAATPLSRTLGSTRKSGESKTEESEAEVARVKARDTLNSVLNDDNIRGLLDEDTVKLYDQLHDEKKRDKLKEEDYTKVAKKISEGATLTSDYKNKLLENEQYDSLLKTMAIKRALAEKDPKTAPSDLETIDRNVTRVGIYKKYKVPHSQIEEYFTADISDWKKMDDPDSEFHDIDKYNRIAQLDQAMADSKVSRDSDYPNKRYFPDETKGDGKGKGSGKGGSGGGKATIGTNIGTLSSGATKTVSSDLKYRALTRFDSPIPNLSAQAAKTNLKKSISVKKGVRL